jgi:hypothetical protein
VPKVQSVLIVSRHFHLAIEFRLASPMYVMVIVPNAPTANPLMNFPAKNTAFVVEIVSTVTPTSTNMNATEYTSFRPILSVR